MSVGIRSVRAFIGAKNFAESRDFYRTIGFVESVIGPDMSYFRIAENLGFYLQDYYVRKWVDNTMLFLEVSDPAIYRADLLDRKLTDHYPGVRISEVKDQDWGREFFMHDPAGVLWHIGNFN